MASLFKIKARNQKLTNWRGKYRDEHGRWTKVTLYTDRAASLEELRRLQRQADQRRAGILTPETDAATKPLEDHIDDYVADCKRQDFDAKHLYMLESMLQRAVAFGKWTRLSDIQPDKVRVVLGLLDKAGAGPATCNYYLARLKSFCNWCVKQRRMVANPLACLEKTKASPKGRRAFSNDQIATLLATAPEPRATLYRFAVLSGLRRGELAALRWGDLRMDAARPFIQLRAEQTKNGKADVLPLHPALQAALKATMPGHPDAKVFPVMPTIKCFRKDLTAAGIDAKAYDFHCLRHTFCTMVVKSGCSLKEAQQLMRHSTVELTSRVYTHLGITDIAGALDNVPLPALSGPALKTGTMDNPECVDQMCDQTTLTMPHHAAQQCTNDDALSAARTLDGACDKQAGNLSKSTDLHGASQACNDNTCTAGDGIRTHDVQLGKLAFYR